VAGELLVPMYPDRVVLVDGSGASLREGFLKIRSGAADYPINQAADRAFQLVIFR
jgi:hypothetical protein